MVQLVLNMELLLNLLYHDGMKDTAMNIYNWLKLADLLPIPLQGMIFTGFNNKKIG